MNRSSVALTLEQIFDFLHKEAVFLLSPENRRSFIERTGDLLEKAASPGELLYVGILGGTGVGKSTLINALARKEISSPSDRRPFTDRIVAYRHREAARALENMSHLFRTPDAVHDSHGIKSLVLLDLPDFDSQENANRRTVLEILPSLDCVVWVVSPEKYADAIFYRFVKQTAINQENFTFVLNKSDELVAENSPHPHGSLKEVLGDLAFRLKHEAGLEEPRIFSVSALSEFQGRAAESVLQDEFRKLRDFLMAKRDSKDIASMKTANLVEETRRLLGELNESIRPDEKAELLNTLRAASSGGPPQETSVSSRSLSGAQEKLSQALFGHLLNEDASIGPVRLGMRLLSLARRRARDTAEHPLEEVFRDAAHDLIRERRPDLEKVAARMDSELMLALRHSGAFASVREPEQVLNQAVTQATGLFAQAVERRRKSLGGTFSTWRRLFQRLVLLVPVGILVLRLAGAGTVEKWVEQPGLMGAVKIALLSLVSLFGAEGLIGLAALLICELILVGYLSSRRLRSIEKASALLARRAIEYLDGALDSAFTVVEEDRRQTIHCIQEGVDRLGTLNSALSPSWNTLVRRSTNAPGRLPNEPVHHKSS